MIQDYDILAGNNSPDTGDTNPLLPIWTPNIEVTSSKAPDTPRPGGPLIIIKKCEKLDAMYLAGKNVTVVVTVQSEYSFHMHYKGHYGK